MLERIHQALTKCEHTELKARDLQIEALNIELGSLREIAEKRAAKIEEL